MARAVVTLSALTLGPVIGARGVRILTDGLVQIGVSIAQAIEPPQRSSDLDPIEQSLHALRDVAIIFWHRNMNFGEWSVDLISQTPTCWKT